MITACMRMIVVPNKKKKSINGSSRIHFSSPCERLRRKKIKNVIDGDLVSMSSPERKSNYKSRPSLKMNKIETKIFHEKINAVGQILNK